MAFFTFIFSIYLVQWFMIGLDKYSFSGNLFKGSRHNSLTYYIPRNSR